MKKKNAILSILFLSMLILFFCPNRFIAAQAAGGGLTDETIILATTYSVFDTGLLDELLKEFKSKTGISVKPIVAGSGESLKLGERGECDIILAHSPALEEKFMEEKYGKDRKSFARNEFYIIGPESDPAGVKNAADVFAAFARLDSAGVFISRGDNSGTHNREMSIWKKTGVSKKAGSNYIITGQGMAETLKIADEKQAYTLCDSATFTYMNEKLTLKKIYSDIKNLSNIYSVITINPEKNKHAKYEPAKKLYDYILSAETLKFIGEFGKEKFNKPLFNLME